MGVTLLHRTSREVRLTAAGEVLLAEGRGALGAMAAAVQHRPRNDLTGLDSASTSRRIAEFLRAAVNGCRERPDGAVSVADAAAVAARHQGDPA